LWVSDGSDSVSTANVKGAPIIWFTPVSWKSKKRDGGTIWLFGRLWWEMKHITSSHISQYKASNNRSRILLLGRVVKEESGKSKE
jgi:hypothetical protein